MILAGNMPQTTAYVIDGIATRGGRLGESSLNLSVAAIDQFKVQQSFFMPDQGPDPALVNVTTKGGGNQFHGQAFEFVRNERFDARNFFAPAAENLKRNQFGGALGGPIRKDKIWFYGYYEGLRQLQAFTSSAYTPTAAMFGGDLSAVLPQAIFDPATYSAATSDAPAVPRQHHPVQPDQSGLDESAQVLPARFEPGAAAREPLRQSAQHVERRPVGHPAGRFASLPARLCSASSSIRTRPLTSRDCSRSAARCFPTPATSS